MKNAMTTTEKKTPADLRRGHQRQFLKFYEGHFVLDVRSGRFYRLTPSAIFLLRAWSEGAETSSFSRLLREEFEVDLATASRDVELMLNQFKGLGLIDAESAEASS
jgi:hypothetical protein